jgi:hypothetical protein
MTLAQCRIGGRRLYTSVDQLHNEEYEAGGAMPRQADREAVQRAFGGCGRDLRRREWGWTWGKAEEIKWAK